MNLFRKLKRKLSEHQARKDQQRRVQIARLKDENKIAAARQKEKETLSKLRKEKFQRSFFGKTLKSVGSEVKSLRDRQRAKNIDWDSSALKDTGDSWESGALKNSRKKKRSNDWF